MLLKLGNHSGRVITGVICVLVFLISNVKAQQESPRQGLLWKADKIFEHNVFIENNGQFNLNELQNTAQPRFAYANSNFKIYFCASELIYEFTEIVKYEHKEEKYLDSEKFYEEEERKHPPQHIPRRIFIKWENCSPDIEIVSLQKENYYFSYPNPYSKKEKGITAAAFKKIIYKNVYPGIDAEFIFPDDKKGIKYAYIIHPGADASQIKMKYEGAELVKDNEGNIEIKNSVLALTDHAPFTFYSDTKSSVASSFHLSGNTVSFQIDDYDKTRELTIDPWTSATPFTGFKGAYDVEFDNAGNVYVFGGDFPYEEIKFNSAGAMQWIYVASAFGPWTYYGDFTVDPESGSSYLFECWNYASQGVKLNSSGIQIKYCGGDPALQEIFRVMLHACTKKIIIAGGSYGTNCAQLDTDFVALEVENPLGVSDYGHDMSLLAQQKDGYVYMATNFFLHTGWDTVHEFNNIMIKLPDTLRFPKFWVHDNHSFSETGSVNYINNTTERAGFNGMAVSMNSIYTYDGKLIQRWNKYGGGLIQNKVISSVPFSWGGLAVDDCNHIYAGRETEVVELDTLFNVVQTFPAGKRVFDVRLNNLNQLCVSGEDFVSVFQLNKPPCPSFAAVTKMFPCAAYGVAAAYGLNGNLPYSFVWNPSNDSSAMTDPISAGVHTVTITDASCGVYRQSVTAEVSVAYGPAPSIISPDTTCPGEKLLLTADQPGDYKWNGSIETDTLILYPQSSATYTVKITTPSGCVNSASKTVHVINPPDPNITGEDSLCVGYETTLTAHGGDKFLWSTGSVNSLITVKPAKSTTYFVSVSNSGCSAPDSIRVVVYPPAIASAVVVYGTGIEGQLFGNGGILYHWFPGEGLSCVDCPSPYVRRDTTSNYCTAIVDSNGCMDTACVKILVSAAFIPNAFTPNDDGLNDVFLPVIMDVYDYSFVIYNRWGEIVFETNDVKEGWDGIYRNRKCTAGIYVYRIAYKDAEDHEPHKHTGKITLVR